jgi:hypothetical protein
MRIGIWSDGSKSRRFSKAGTEYGALPILTKVNMIYQQQLTPEIIGLYCHCPVFTWWNWLGCMKRDGYGRQNDTIVSFKGNESELTGWDGWTGWFFLKHYGKKSIFYSFEPKQLLSPPEWHWIAIRANKLLKALLCILLVGILLLLFLGMMNHAIELFSLSLKKMWKQLTKVNDTALRFYFLGKVEKTLCND